MMQNDLEIISKNKFSNQNVQFWYLRHPALSNSLQDVKSPAVVVLWLFVKVEPVREMSALHLRECHKMRHKT